MNLEHFISSGKLEAYVLGLLSEREIAEVEQYIAHFPELKAELSSIEEALERYAMATAIDPPPGLEQSILNTIRSEKITPSTSTNQVSKGSTSAWPWILGLLALAAAAAAFYFFSQLSDVRQDLQDAKDQNQQLLLDCDTIRQNAQQTSQMIAYLRATQTRQIEMKGTALSPSSKAIVFWNDDQDAAYLDVRQLPEPPSDKQYQLWAIVDGTPVSMGVFEIGAQFDGLQSVPFIENPQAFAVTLEPRGGSENPTLEQMYVIGEVG